LGRTRCHPVLITYQQFHPHLRIVALFLFNNFVGVLNNHIGTVIVIVYHFLCND
jgi:hypothetical protein